MSPIQTAITCASNGRPDREATQKARRILSQKYIWAHLRLLRRDGQALSIPPEIKSKDYLSFYAQHFDTVEVNSTLYGCPSPRTVENWAAKTPDNFIFSIKTPRSITHDKILVNCDAELEEFLTTMEILGPKLGPILFQFPQFSPGVFADRHAFTDRLIPFLKKLPAGPQVRHRDSQSRVA